jgi:adhesin transport system outer membrane protein
MGLKPMDQGTEYARQEFGVPATVQDANYVELDSHQSADKPFDLLAPIRSQ